MNACNFSVCIAFFNVRERKKRKTSTEPSRTDTQTLFTPVSSRVAAAFAAPASASAAASSYSSAAVNKREKRR